MSAAVLRGDAGFLNREDELAGLEEMWREPGGRMFILWGRRRVGKTELLSRFVEGKRAVYFEATDTSASGQLRAFSAELAGAHPSSLLASQPAADWETALAGLAEYAGQGERTVVVLDEFQYLAARDPGLETLLNTWWRRVGRDLPLMLILAGSEIAFFRDNVLAGKMYGRRDGQLAVLPFEPQAAGLFTPCYSPEDRVRTFAVCGGMPYYLAHWDDSRSVAENILGRILNRDGLLHEEAELVLRQELPEPSAYASILEAIAAGRTRNNEIANHTGADRASVYQHLKLLERLQLVEQRRPVTASPRSKKTSYAILDGFLAFHFRFVAPYRSRLRTRDGARQHLEATVMPGLDEFVSRQAWERVCRDRVFREEPEAVTVGAWWGRVRTDARRTEERELDIVALGRRGEVLATGSCKWTASPVSRSEESVVGELEAHVPGVEGSRPLRHYFFSRSGFTAGMRRLAEAEPERIRLRGPADIYAD